MKKLFIILALAGMTGNVAASTVASFSSSSALVIVKGGDKDKKKSKTAKSCSKDGKASGCCKDKQKAAAETPAPANKPK